MQIRIKEIMIEKGVSSVSLAETIGVSKVTISNLINNKTMPSVDTLDKISCALDVPIWQLFASAEEAQECDKNIIACPHCGGKIQCVEVKSLFALKGDEVTGFVKNKGEIRELKSKTDIESALELLESSQVRNIIDKEEMINNLIASARIEGATISREQAEAIWEKVIAKRE